MLLTTLKYAFLLKKKKKKQKKAKKKHKKAICTYTSKNQSQKESSRMTVSRKTNKKPKKSNKKHEKATKKHKKKSMLSQKTIQKCCF